MSEIKLLNQGGKVLVSSRVVAEDFGKRHDNVVRIIEAKIQEFNALKIEVVKYFKESSYNDSKGELRKEFLLTRDGFSFIVMGFTGTKADEFKLQYIEAFNKMEQALTQPKQLTQWEMMKVMFNEVDEQKKKVEKLEAGFVELKDNAPLYAVECEILVKAVSNKVITILGGKTSNSYKDKKIRDRVYSIIWRQVKDKFEVKTYKGIKRKHLEVAIKVAANADIPLPLEQKIENLNNQMELFERGDQDD